MKNDHTVRISKGQCLTLKINQYFSSERKIANELNLSYRQVKKSISRILSKKIIDKETISINGKKIGTVFTVLIPKNKRGTTNQGELDTKRVPLNQKRVPLAFKKGTTKSTEKIENSKGSKTTKINDFQAQKEVEMFKNLTRDLNEGDFKKGTTSSEKGYQHVNKYIKINNSLSYSPLSYKSISMTEKELRNEFLEFLDLYKKLSGKIAETEFEKFKKDKLPDYADVRHLCAFYGYLKNQIEHDPNPRFTKQFSNLSTSKLEKKHINRGYVFYQKKYGKIEELPENVKTVVNSDSLLDASDQDFYEKSKTYWMKLLKDDPVEADKIAVKASKLSGVCLDKGFSSLVANMANKGGERMKFGFISAVLQKDKTHYPKIILTKKETLKEEKVANQN